MPLRLGGASSEEAEDCSCLARPLFVVPGVHTAIVGTTKAGRWRENAEMLAAGPLPAETFERIRTRWRAVAEQS